MHRVNAAGREIVYLHAARLREDARRQPAAAILDLRLIRFRIGHRLRAHDELCARAVVNAQHHRRVQRRLRAVDRKFEDVMKSALCADSFEPQARRYIWFRARFLCRAARMVVFHRLASSCRQPLAVDYRLPVTDHWPLSLPFSFWLLKTEN